MREGLVARSEETTTDLSLPRQSVKFFESSSGYAPFKDAIILFCVDIERFFVDGSVILNLVNWRILIAMILGKS